MSSTFEGYRQSEFVCIPNSENCLKDKHELSTFAIRYHCGIILVMGSPDAKNSTKVIHTPKRLIQLNSFTLGAVIYGDDDSQRLCESLKKQNEIHETYEHQKLPLDASLLYLQDMSNKFRFKSPNIVLAGFEKDKPYLYLVKSNKIQKVSKYIAIGKWATKAWAIMDRFYRVDLTDNEAYKLALRCISDESSSNIWHDGSVTMYKLRSEGLTKVFGEKPEREGREDKASKGNDFHSKKTKIDISKRLGGCITKSKNRSSKTLSKSSKLYIKSCKKEILAESRNHCNRCSAKTLQLMVSNEPRVREVSSEQSFVSSWDSDNLEAKPSLIRLRKISKSHSFSCNRACKAPRSWFWSQNPPQYLMQLNDKEEESSPGNEENNEEGSCLEKEAADASLEPLELKPSIVQTPYMKCSESKIDSKAFKPPFSFDKCYFFSFNTDRIDNDNMNFPHQPKKIVNTRKPLLNDRMNISRLWPDKTNAFEPLQQEASLDEETTEPYQK